VVPSNEAAVSTTDGGIAERRRSSAAHVRALLDHALDAVVALDGEGRINFWNPQAERTFGYPRDEAVGRELASLVIAELDREGFREAFRIACLQAMPQQPRHEMQGQRRDGSQFPVEITLTPTPDGIFCVSVFARDITERKRAEQERERLLSESEMHRQEAESASRVKDEFLATLSHELRTPLTAIVGWIYLLRGGRLDEATRARGLEAIDRNAAAQAKVLGDIVDMSRIVGAKLLLNVRPLQLAPVVAAAIDSLLPAAHARGVKIQPNLDPSAGLVSGDPDRLRQVVWNLLSNAVKFTEKGGRVTVRVEKAGDEAQISVEDTGVGISRDFLPHVFERFRQGDSSNTRSHGGLGLGLAVVRHLIEMHGGTVTAESGGTGQGSTFVVRIPLHQGGEAQEDPAPPVFTESRSFSFDREELPPNTPQLDGVQVVVVDDGEDVRDVISTILRQNGATVRAAGTAKEALDLIAQKPPDVLLSEVEMKGETGHSLISRVRMLPPDRGGTVPAAALSAYSRSEDRVQALLAGFQIHLTKPVRPAELVAVIAALARRNVGEAAGSSHESGGA
jgi:PAS domain S-box-containing protein